MTISPFWLTSKEEYAINQEITNQLIENLTPKWSFTSLLPTPFIPFDLSSQTSSSSLEKDVLSVWHKKAIKEASILTFSYVKQIETQAINFYIQSLFEKLKIANQTKDVKNAFLIKSDIIAEIIRITPSFHRVVIIDNEDEFQVTVNVNALQSYVPQVFQKSLDSSENIKENIQTLDFLQNHFGKERTQRLFSMMEMDFRFLLAHGLAITVKQLATFFALTAFVHIKDMQEIFNDLNTHADNNIPFLYLPLEEVKQIKKQFEGKTFKELTKQDYDILWDIMTPLSLSTMFINKFDKDIPDQGRGANLEGIIKGLYVEQHHVKLRPNMPQRDYDYTLMKSLIGGFTEHNSVSIKGRVVRQKKGYGYMLPMIASGGCYCIPLKAMGATKRENTSGKNSEDMNKHDAYLSKLLFLPMQTFASFLPNIWESLAGSLRKDMGSKGALTIWPYLEKLFQKEGFDRVDLVGTSMGGTQAAKIALLSLDTHRVRKLTLVCAPAEDQMISKAFSEKITSTESLHEDEYLLRITSIWHEADRVQVLGDEEIATCAIKEDIERVAGGNKPKIKQKIYYYVPEEDNEKFANSLPEKPLAPNSFASSVKEAYLGLMGSHREDLSIDGDHFIYKMSTVNERELVIKHAQNNSLGWENVRETLLSFIPQDSHFTSAIK